MYLSDCKSGQFIRFKPHSTFPNGAVDRFRTYVPNDNHSMRMILSDLTKRGLLPSNTVDLDYYGRLCFELRDKLVIEDGVNSNNFSLKMSRESYGKLSDDMQDSMIFPSKLAKENLCFKDGRKMRLALLNQFGLGVKFTGASIVRNIKVIVEIDDTMPLWKVEVLENKNET